MSPHSKFSLAGWFFTGFLIFFPDPNQPSEVRGVTGLPAKISKAKIMRLKSQLIARPKTKLNDQEDAQLQQGNDTVDEDLGE